MIEGREFTIFTDHKPLTFAFAQKPKKHTQRQFCWLYLIGQYSTNILHVAGKNNVVADVLSRIEAVAQALEYAELAKSQREDEELRILLQLDSSLQLRKVTLPGSNDELYCDSVTSTLQPFVTKPFRRQAFASLHELSHPGAKATAKLVAQRFVWPAHEISRHVSALTGQFRSLSSRFEHVHVYIIGPLPISQRQRYSVTCVNWFTRWPEAFPVENISAEW
ncbi:uncharacterized protein LOC143433263 [Xylocopa sonorina]|uniref:uncharacterized protein LOC143433263 n=1 Tax=Xylocopa sonorina TaxID=1818115 RepID=UPI00403ACCCA